MNENYRRRFSAVLPYEKIAGITAMVIGCGGIGSWVAPWLSKMGLEIDLVDFDVVEEVNVGTQNFGPGDVDYPKVERVMMKCVTAVTMFNTRVESLSPGNVAATIFVLALDSLPARQTALSWIGSVKEQTQEELLVVDPRMSLDTFEVHCHEFGTPGYNEYVGLCFPNPATLDSEPCTARGLPYSGVAPAMVTCDLVRRWLQGKAAFGSVYGDLGDLSMDVAGTLTDTPV